MFSSGFLSSMSRPTLNSAIAAGYSLSVSWVKARDVMNSCSVADGNYAMKLDIEPGEYHLIAWAGLDNQSFAVPVLYPQTSQITELKVKTLREEFVPTRSEDEKDKYIVEKELSSLWHGEVKKSAFTRSGRERITEVSLQYIYLFHLPNV